MSININEEILLPDNLIDITEKFNTQLNLNDFEETLQEYLKRIYNNKHYDYGTLFLSGYDDRIDLKYIENRKPERLFYIEGIEYGNDPTHMFNSKLQDKLLKACLFKLIKRLNELNFRTGIKDNYGSYYIEFYK